MKQGREDEMSEQEVDENLADSFPASDPPSWTLGTDHKEEQPDPDEENSASES